jgi:hypothetical protein
MADETVDGQMLPQIVDGLAVVHGRIADVDQPLQGLIRSQRLGLRQDVQDGLGVGGLGLARDAAPNKLGAPQSLVSRLQFAIDHPIAQEIVQGRSFEHLPSFGRPQGFSKSLVFFHKTDLDFPGGIRQGLRFTQAPGSTYEAPLGLDLTGRRPLYVEPDGFSLGQGSN